VISDYSVDVSVESALVSGKRPMIVVKPEKACKAKNII